MPTDLAPTDGRRTDVQTFGVVGCGVIGAGWATRALARGWDVIATDPAPDAEAKLRSAINRAWPSVQKLGTYPGADRARLRFVPSIEAVGAAADFIQESAPEREDLKRSLHTAIDRATPPDVIVASSSSGLLPSRIQAGAGHAERIVIGHPFNPVYLLPLVEVVAGDRTATDAVDGAIAVYEDLDMYPVRVRNEIEGYLSDRLQEAMWREILHLVTDDIATTGELDDAVIYGPGLRWAAMGTNLTFHLAGGDDGMRHMLEQFGPALQLPWTKLVAPELTDDLVDRMVDGTEAQADGRTIAELERQRDDALIATMRALRAVGIGAGNVLARREARRFSAGAATWEPGEVVATPLELYRCAVEPDWVDYNGHMTEAAFLTAFGWASDALFRYIGDDEAYRAAGHSFFTVETHINYLREARADDPLRFTTQILGLDAKRLHFYHEMYHEQSGDLLCTTEQMLVHVDLHAGRSAPIADGPRRALDAIWEAHQHMQAPANVGRTMSVGS